MQLLCKTSKELEDVVNGSQHKERTKRNTKTPLLPLLPQEAIVANALPLAALVVWLLCTLWE